MVEIKLPMQCKIKPILFAFLVRQMQNNQRLYKQQNERIGNSHKACLQGREGEEGRGGV